jgi:hypothetical protein
MNIHEYRVGGITPEQRRLFSIAEAIEGYKSKDDWQLELKLISAYLRGKAIGLDVPKSLEALVFSQLTYLDVGKEVYRLIKNLDR